jgi:hypothetical protein
MPTSGSGPVGGYLEANGVQDDQASPGKPAANEALGWP